VAALSVFVIGAGIALGLSDARSRAEGPATLATERPISEEATPDTMGV
jgi:hypothetical protein